MSRSTISDLFDDFFDEEDIAEIFGQAGRIIGKVAFRSAKHALRVRDVRSSVRGDEYTPKQRRKINSLLRGVAGEVKIDRLSLETRDELVRLLEGG